MNKELKRYRIEFLIGLGLILLLILLLTGFTFQEKVKLQTVIDKCPYSPKDYIQGEFDCSNMAAMLGDWLDLYGYHVKYIIGYSNRGGHVWLKINDDEYVSSTSKLITTEEDYKEYYYRETYDNYHDVKTYKEEWDYSKKVK